MKGRSNPEPIDVTITHHGPIVNDGAGRRGRAAARAAVDRPPASVHHRGGLPDGARAERGRDHRRDGAPRGPSAEHALRRQRREHRLPARRPHPDPARRLPRPARSRAGPASSSGTATIPYEELPRVTNPPEGFIVTANNRIVGDDYPHHITSEWMTGYRARAHRGDARRARAPLTRGTSSGCSTTSTRSRASRPSTASRACTRRASASVRAIERLKSWDGHLDPRHDRRARSIHAFTVVFAQAVVRPPSATSELAER